MSEKIKKVSLLGTVDILKYIKIILIRHRIINIVLCIPYFLQIIYILYCTLFGIDTGVFKTDIETGFSALYYALFTSLFLIIPYTLFILLPTLSYSKFKYEKAKNIFDTELKNKDKVLIETDYDALSTIK